MSSATVRLDHAALRETLRQLFGLPAGSVIDADQLLAPPAIPFMTLRLESLSLLGKVRRSFPPVVSRSPCWPVARASFA